MTTIVSAFVCNCNTNRSFEKYIEYGKELLLVQKPKIIFIEKETYEKLKDFPSNLTTYIIIEKSDLLFKTNTKLELPKYRNKTKDTLDYLIVQNNKISWVEKAIKENPYNSNQFVWVDFGIFHICSDRKEFQIMMNKLYTGFYNKIRIAQIWDLNKKVCDDFNSPLWYFAGGIFGGSVNALTKFNTLVKNEIDKLINNGKFCWEVNIWYKVYIANKDLFSPYLSDHNSTMLSRYIEDRDNNIGKVWENIDKIIYINLDRRKDRREQIEKEFIKMNIPVEKVYRLSAVNNINRPEVGCFSSHIKALEIAKKNKYNNVLILEDDFKFVISKEAVSKNLMSFFNSQIEYDVVMFSYNLNKGEKMNNLLGRVLYAQTTSGYLVNSKFIDRMLDNWRIGIKKLISTRIHWHYAIDVYWKHLQCDSNWYYFLDKIGKQRGSYSDVAQKYTDYGC